MTVVMVLTAVPLGGVTFSASAEDGEFTEGYYTYTVENGEAKITGCNNSISGEVVIPSSLGGYPVTKIGERALAYCDITSVEIPNSVTSIGNYAFFNCTSLTSIEIPDSVTSIAYQAFKDCSSLTSVTIPNSVTSICTYAFYGCSSLTSVTIPDSVTSIDYGAFENCSSLTSVTIGNSVTSIGYQAFEDCISLTSVTIPDSVTSIGNYAFDNTAYYNNSSNWENGVLYIGNHLIKAESSVSGAYQIKDGTKTIADCAFSGCSSLTSITIPDSVTSISNSAFYGCSSLTCVTIPDGVTSIGEHAFFYCSSLTSVTITDSVTSIGEHAFNKCHSLTSIDVATDNPNYSSLDGVLFNKDKTKLIQYPIGNTRSEYAIPDSVTSIDGSTFE